MPLQIDPRAPLDPQGRLATAYLAWTDAAGNPQIFIPDLVLEETWTGNATITENPVEIGANITDNIRVELRKCSLKFFLTQEPIEANGWTQVPFTPQVLELPSRTVTPPPTPILFVPEWENLLEERVLVSDVGNQIGGIGASVASLVNSFALAGRAIIVPTTTDAGQAAPAATGGSVSIGIFAPDNEDDYVALSIQFLETLKNEGQTIDVIGTKDSVIGTTQGVGGMAIETFTWSRSFEDGTGATVTLGLKEIRIVQTATVPAPSPSLPRAKKPTNGGNQQTGALGDAANKIGGAFIQGVKNGSSDIQTFLSGGGI